MTDLPESWQPPRPQGPAPKPVPRKTVGDYFAQHADELRAANPILPVKLNPQAFPVGMGDTVRGAPDVKRAAGSTKCPLNLLPPEFLRQTAWALKHGADRYGAFNWRESGVRLDTYVAAIMRHLTSMAEGEWLDPDSGKPHAAHIAASSAILLDCDHLGKLDGKEGPTPERKG
ncbi:MAG: dATP/dGTP diphosphohydrolase domain-containing protein [Phycisphaerales bacterium]|jgi:hypothetical protein